MKIYQVHRRGGEWEDYYNYIVASYLHEENAMKKKEELEEAQNKLIDRHNECDKCYDYYEEIGFDKCEKDCFIKYFDPYEEEIICNGYVNAPWEIEDYTIEEIIIEDA